MYSVVTTLRLVNQAAVYHYLKGKVLNVLAFLNSKVYIHVSQHNDKR